jgi:hypothetical protein
MSLIRGIELAYYLSPSKQMQSLQYLEMIHIAMYFVNKLMPPYFGQYSTNLGICFPDYQSRMKALVEHLP